MSETIDGNGEFLIGIPLEVTYTAESTQVRVASITNVTDRDRLREMHAEHWGIDPANVRPATSPSLGRLSVGFRRWNSTWDPHADKAAEQLPFDPNLN
jgi:hypothetical protein